MRQSRGQKLPEEGNLSADFIVIYVGYPSFPSGFRSAGRARLELGVDPREELAVAHAGVARLEVALDGGESVDDGASVGRLAALLEERPQAVVDPRLPVL